MAKKFLVIVESPAKIKTISHILGPDYAVQASVGHIMRIADKGYKNLGIDVQKNKDDKYASFNVKYERLSDHTEVIKNLKLAAQEAELIYLASDADREGHRISAEIVEALKLPKNKYKRIIFNEITEKAIKNAIANPIDMDKNMLDAQEARAVLDKVIGYLLSGLAKKATSAPSVGRCQSAALKLVVEREREINNFIPKQFYEIYVNVLYDASEYVIQYVGTDINKPDREVNSEEQARRIQADCSRGKYYVKDRKNGTKEYAPNLPFITSSLQIEASNKLGFSPEKTMQVAQKLYEGISINGVATGLITYMRTDKPVISDEVKPEVRKFILDSFGQKYLGPEEPIKSKKNKDDHAQEAHEGIRPTHIEYTPIDIKDQLSLEQYRLYDLIWKRTIASQMSNRTLELNKVVINNQEYLFNYNYSYVTFDGWSKVYETEQEKENTNRPLNAKIGDELKFIDFYWKFKETQPPKRYNEANLVKALETNGIGRPSTFAGLIKTIKDREYVEISDKMLVPTDIGIRLIDFLNKNFSHEFDLKYTSKMEEMLDYIAEGKADKIEELQKFYDNLQESIDKVKEDLPATEKELNYVGKDCPKCGNPLVYRISSSGLKFIACSNYPKCKHAEYIRDTSHKCPNCEVGYIIKKPLKNPKDGKTHIFACDNYPKCTTILEESEYNKL